MKQTVVPAQVTTVEDRIVGNLGISQMVLLALPVIVTGLVFITAPPALHIAWYKLLVLIPFAILCAVLAIRIKGKIILFWIIVRVRYNIRPQYYIFNKNTLAHREQYNTGKAADLTESEPEKVALRRKRSTLTTAETIRTFAAIDNPAANLSFTTDKKGKLYVRITEVKQES